MEPPKNHDSRIALGDGSDEPVDSSNYVTAIKIYSAYSAFKKQIRLARLVSMKDIFFEPFPDKIVTSKFE